MTNIFPVSVIVDKSILTVGQIARDEGGKNSASPTLAFRYDPTWLKIGFALGAALPLEPRILTPKNKGAVTNRFPEPIFGFLRDHLPGSWLTRATDSENTMTEAVDFLFKNTASLRFSSLFFGKEAPSEAPAPILTKALMGKLTRATESYFRDPSRLTEEERNLIDTLGDTFGGLKIKFRVRTEKNPDTEYVLRPRNPASQVDEPLWAAVTMTLAKKAGLKALSGRFIPSLGYLEERFDRAGGNPLFCLSAATLAKGGDNAASVTWLDIADILNREGSKPKEDLRELFSRLVFDMVVLNSRDIPENIWFYRHEGGWRLCPVSYALSKPSSLPFRTLQTAVVGKNTLADTNTALSVARYFNLSARQAKEIILTTLRVTRDWESTARFYGALRSDCTLMQSAFAAETV